MIAVADMAGIKSAVFWGYSRGAWLAAIAAEFPDRVSALVLGGADLPKSEPRDSPPWLAPLSRSEWAAFWAAFGIPLDESIRRHFRATTLRQWLRWYREAGQTMSWTFTESPLRRSCTRARKTPSRSLRLRRLGARRCTLCRVPIITGPSRASISSCLS